MHKNPDQEIWPLLGLTLSPSSSQWGTWFPSSPQSPPLPLVSLTDAECLTTDECPHTHTRVALFIVKWKVWDPCLVSKEKTGLGAGVYCRKVVFSPPHSLHPSFTLMTGPAPRSGCLCGHCCHLEGEGLCSGLLTWSKGQCFCGQASFKK